MWAMAKEPLTTSLLKLKDPQEQEKALLLFKLVRCGVVRCWCAAGRGAVLTCVTLCGYSVQIMKFMEEPSSFKGMAEIQIGNYIIREVCGLSVIRYTYVCV